MRHYPDESPYIRNIRDIRRKSEQHHRQHDAFRKRGREPEEIDRPVRDLRPFSRLHDTDYECEKRYDGSEQRAAERHVSQSFGHAVMIHYRGIQEHAQTAYGDQQIVNCIYALLDPVPSVEFCCYPVEIELFYGSLLV